MDHWQKLEAAARMRREPSPPEKIFWERRAELGRFFLPIQRQVLVRGYIADFVNPRLRAVIEIDGAQHLEYDAALYDVRRGQVFLDADYSVFRLPAFCILSDADRAMEVAGMYLSEVHDRRCGGFRRTVHGWLSHDWCIHGLDRAPQHFADGDFDRDPGLWMHPASECRERRCGRLS